MIISGAPGLAEQQREALKDAVRAHQERTSQLANPNVSVQAAGFTFTGRLLTVRGETEFTVEGMVKQAAATGKAAKKAPAKKRKR